MNLNKLGNFVGVLGFAVCLLSGLARLLGESVFFLQIQSINIYIVGIGLMVFGCFAKLSGR